MIVPRIAPVRPRVYPPDGGDAVPLEFEVLELLGAGATGRVAVLGPAGSGKTTALAHLAAVLPVDARVTIFDSLVDADAASLKAAESFGLTVYGLTGTAPERTESQPNVKNYRLAPWGEDDLVEYLLATHKDRCGSVIGRLRAAADRGLPGGNPRLWAIVLQRMAADESLLSVRDSLRSHLNEQFADPESRELARKACLSWVLTPAQVQASLVSGDSEVHRRLAELSRRIAGSLVEDVLSTEARIDALMALLHHEPVRHLMAAEQVVAELRDRPGGRWSAARMPREVVREAGRMLALDERALVALRAALVSCSARAKPMAVSLLHAAGQPWLTAKHRPKCLAGAYLDGANLPFSDLTEVDLTQADLSNATLNDVNLTKAQLVGADFRGADLRGAVLNGALAREARFDAADMTRIRGQNASFSAANLSAADLRGANLASVWATGAIFSDANLTDAWAFEAKFTDCHFSGAVFNNAVLVHSAFVDSNLTDAGFIGANLRGARFVGVTLDGADFSNANLESACLSSLRLSVARFDGARFVKAAFCHADLEGMSLPGADFTGANLRGAYLTATHMPGVKLLDAHLEDAGLAEIDWEGADLRRANLCGATFHMGSTRSGLVGSPLASEGTRTGFYTDDYQDQEFKSIEEIRKANLRGADLRGANLTDVDFYLVDLRDAKYDRAHLEQLRRCGAILEDRCH
jgi:uncharacterized protein YjbI with pentapeptide repeats/energy-coupling factor transporter ATP-binding protein EcfA2